jgi:hypothetical protein
MIPRLRAVDHVVAVAVPAVPIVADGSFRDFVLCFLGASTDRRHLALLQFGNTLWRRYLSFPFAHDDNRVAIGSHFYAHNYVFMRRMNGHIRCVDFRLGFALVEDAVIGQSLGQLNLDVVVSEIGNIGLRVRPQAKNVGEVELDLCSATCGRRNLIAIEHRLI